MMKKAFSAVSKQHRNDSVEFLRQEQPAQAERRSPRNTLRPVNVIHSAINTQIKGRLMSQKKKDTKRINGTKRMYKKGEEVSALFRRNRSMYVDGIITGIALGPASYKVRFEGSNRITTRTADEIKPRCPNEDSQKKITKNHATVPVLEQGQEGSTIDRTNTTVQADTEADPPLNQGTPSSSSIQEGSNEETVLGNDDAEEPMEDTNINPNTTGDWEEIQHVGAESNESPAIEATNSTSHRYSTRNKTIQSYSSNCVTKTRPRRPLKSSCRGCKELEGKLLQFQAQFQAQQRQFQALQVQFKALQDQLAKK